MDSLTFAKQVWEDAYVTYTKARTHMVRKDEEHAQTFRFVGYAPLDHHPTGSNSSTAWCFTADDFARYIE